MGSGYLIEPEPYKFNNFVCVADDEADEKSKLEEQEFDNPKDQGKELVES